MKDQLGPVKGLGSQAAAAASRGVAQIPDNNRHSLVSSQISRHRHLVNQRVSRPIGRSGPPPTRTVPAASNSPWPAATRETLPRR